MQTMTSQSPKQKNTHTQVAIITVTYHSEDFIHDYLIAIKKIIVNKPYRLIIIDNNSKDKTCELIKNFRHANQLFEQISLIESTENLGFGKGCNKGIDLAKTYAAQYYWFLNPDTIPFESSGEYLTKLLDENENAHFASSTLLNNKNEPSPGAFHFPGLMNTVLATSRLAILEKIFPQYTTAVTMKQQPYQADWLTGASFMAKASAINTLKGFTPDYFLYFEEVDLFFRAKQKKLDAWACPDSKVFHISGASTGVDNPNSERKRFPHYWFESRRHFYISNCGHIYFLLINCTLLMCHILWKLRSTIQQREDSTPPHFIKDIIYYSYIKPFSRNRTPKQNNH